MRIAQKINLYLVLALALIAAMPNVALALVETTQVPEPTTALLMAIGLLGVGIFGRKRN